METNIFISGFNCYIDKTSTFVMVLGKNIKVTNSHNCAVIGNNLLVDGKRNLFITNDNIYDLKFAENVTTYICCNVMMDIWNDFENVKNIVLYSGIEPFPVQNIKCETCNDPECVVCYDEQFFCNFMDLPCKHELCLKCFNQMSKTSRKILCPICRRPIGN